MTAPQFTDEELMELKQLRKNTDISVQWIRALATELLSCRRDARRYRWLRLQIKDDNVWQPVTAAEMLDAEIDWAMEQP